MSGEHSFAIRGRNNHRVVEKILADREGPSTRHSRPSVDRIVYLTRAARFLTVLVVLSAIAAALLFTRGLLVDDIGSLFIAFLCAASAYGIYHGPIVYCKACGTVHGVSRHLFERDKWELYRTGEYARPILTI